MQKGLAENEAVMLVQYGYPENEMNLFKDGHNKKMMSFPFYIAAANAIMDSTAK